MGNKVPCCARSDFEKSSKTPLSPPKIKLNGNYGLFPGDMLNPYEKMKLLDKYYLIQVFNGAVKNGPWTEIHKEDEKLTIWLSKKGVMLKPPRGSCKAEFIFDLPNSTLECLIKSVHALKHRKNWDYNFDEHRDLFSMLVC